ncbi:P63C domain-containing protein [Vibrio cyclitrophicus 1F53]|uniref:P63C domain-containing protein n=1 Tax=Vibrio cyclitrophicus TaxID=47951 RepID=UPI0002F51468|nr:P63C domain-containing protein [Vibrio cyclitrophicus]OEF34819.1 hypothetical protein OA7_10745 [Vibrio cyclitrophicus 1F53]OEF63212.1 hypothetical protein OAA_15200 [Vibrio cyclitrophicus 1F175]PMH30349.1 hypothetical protein BCU72_01675 [Vibrio cyclitrophicus]PMH82441.1 hypothetical protein BCU60_14675 [Vibrio cyclitrophicus]
MKIKLMSEEQKQSQTVKNAIDPITEIITDNRSKMELVNVKLDSYIAVHISGRVSRYISLRGAQSILGLTHSDSGQKLIRLANGRLNTHLRPTIRSWFANPTKIHISNGGQEAWALTTRELLDLFESFTDAQIAQDLTEDDLEMAQAARRFTAAFAESRLNLLIDKHNNYATDFQQDKRELADVLMVKKKIKRSKIKPELAIPSEFYSLSQELYPKHKKDTLVRFMRRRFVGKLTTDLIYNQIDPNLPKKLKVVNPNNKKGFQNDKNMQYMSAYGQDMVKYFQQTAIIALSVSNSRAEAIKMASLINLPFKQKINEYRPIFELGKK